MQEMDEQHQSTMMPPSWMTATAAKSSQARIPHHAPDFQPPQSKGREKPNEEVTIAPSRINRNGSKFFSPRSKAAMALSSISQTHQPTYPEEHSQPSPHVHQHHQQRHWDPMHNTQHQHVPHHPQVMIHSFHQRQPPASFQESPVPSAFEPPQFQRKTSSTCQTPRTVSQNSSVSCISENPSRPPSRQPTPSDPLQEEEGHPYMPEPTTPAFVPTAPPPTSAPIRYLCESHNQHPQHHYHMQPPPPVQPRHPPSMECYPRSSRNDSPPYAMTLPNSHSRMHQHPPPHAHIMETHENGWRSSPYHHGPDSRRHHDIEMMVHSTPYPPPPSPHHHHHHEHYQHHQQPAPEFHAHGHYDALPPLAPHATPRASSLRLPQHGDATPQVETPDQATHSQHAVPPNSHAFMPPPPYTVRRGTVRPPPGQDSSSLVTPTPPCKRSRTSSSSRGGTNASSLARSTSSSSPTTGGSDYSRKKKSLGVLADTFINQYRDASTGTEIIVDQLAGELKVERRRIYDVVNIFEALKLVVKKGKNRYHWMGQRHLPHMMALLQDEAIYCYPDNAKQAGLWDDSWTEQQITQSTHSWKRSRDDSPHNKSLSRLSQQFLQVFLVGPATVSLADASDTISGGSSTLEQLAQLGTPDDSALPTDPYAMQKAAARGLKTKIRRLYDIANVFHALGVLRKVEEPKGTRRFVGNPLDTRRPCYRWAYSWDAHSIRNLYEATPPQVREERCPFASLEAATKCNDGTAEQRLLPQGSSPQGDASRGAMSRAAACGSAEKAEEHKQVLTYIHQSGASYFGPVGSSVEDASVCWEDPPSCI